MGEPEPKDKKVTEVLKAMVANDADINVKPIWATPSTKTKENKK